MGLDGVVILGVPVQIHGYVEMQQRFPVSTKLHVNLAQLEVHARLLGSQAPDLFQVIESLVETLQGHEHTSLLEIRHAVLRLPLRGPVEIL